MKIHQDTPLVEVARAVCTALDEAGVTAVLTGGSALHWNDRSGLAQALAVARAVGDQIDFAALAAWAEEEEESSKYREFARRLG